MSCRLSICDPKFWYFGAILVPVTVIVEYADFLSRTMESYVTVLSVIQEKGIQDDLVCSKLSSIAQSLKSYKTSIKDECEDIAADVKDYISGISRADNFKFPTDITSTIASICSSVFVSGGDTMADSVQIKVDTAELEKSERKLSTLSKSISNRRVKVQFTNAKGAVSDNITTAANQLNEIGATFGGHDLTEFKAKFNDYLTEHQLYGMAQLVLLKDGKIAYPTKYNYTDYLSEEHYAVRETLYVNK